VWDDDWGRERWQVGRYTLIGSQDQSHAGWKEYFPSMPPTKAEADPGAYDATVRLERMDEYGIAVQFLYPNLLGFFPFAFMDLGLDAATACVRAYNDFQVEWCSADPRRLIPLAFLPFWDLDAAQAELRRCAELGFPGFNWGHKFENIGLPPMIDRHWDPVLAQAQELRMPASFHIGFGSVEATMADKIKVMYDPNLATDERDLGQARFSVLLFLGNAGVVVDLCMGGVCDRFPDLDFVSIESGFGYVPFLLEAMDWQWKNNRGSLALRDRPLPSDYFRRQVYATFWYEKDSLPLLEQLPDNVMFESDYPHGTSLSPGPGTTALSAQATVDAHFGGLSPDVRRKVLHDNAARVYHLEV
jgi:predicted TIM-barrel fold metal-dependent hydrolase